MLELLLAQAQTRITSGSPQGESGNSDSAYSECHAESVDPAECSGTGSEYLSLNNRPQIAYNVESEHVGPVSKDEEFYYWHDTNTSLGALYGMFPELEQTSR